MNLAFVYVDLGDQFYRMATHEMVGSARKVMPDVKITQLSDGKTPQHPMTDEIIRFDQEVTKENVTLFKGITLATHAMNTHDDLIMSDVDLIWNKSPEPLFDMMQDNVAGLLVRDGFPSMPFNTGLMLAKSRQRDDTPWAVRARYDWWDEYLSVILDLDKNGMGNWYCDQIAMAIHAGRCSNPRFDHRVFPMDEICPAPDTAPSGPLEGYAIHFKGPRKAWLQDYARVA